MSTELNRSIDRFATRLKKFIRDNEICDEDTKFGAWDESFLATLIATWLQMHKNLKSSEKSGMNSIFYPPGGSEDDIAARKRFHEIMDTLITGFTTLSKGNSGTNNLDEHDFDELMKMFGDYFYVFWN